MNILLNRVGKVGMLIDVFEGFLLHILYTVYQALNVRARDYDLSKLWV